MLEAVLGDDQTAVRRDSSSDPADVADGDFAAEEEVPCHELVVQRSEAVAAPTVVGELELEQKLGQDRCPISFDPVVAAQRRCGKASVARERLGWLVDVEPDPELHVAAAALCQDPRDLASVLEHVVRPLDGSDATGGLLDGLRHREARDERNLRGELRIERAQQQRHEDGHARRRVPPPSETPAARRLHLRDGDCALGVAVLEGVLGRLERWEVPVRAAEASTEKGQDPLRRERLVHRGHYTILAVGAVDLEGPSSRPLLRAVRYATLPDADLVRRAKAGDRKALDALVERYSVRVSRLASQLLGDIEDARDAAQESLLKLSERLRQFRGECQFSTWLHRLVVNTCRDLAERQRLRRSEELDAERDLRVDEDSDPSRVALVAELRRELAQGLARLTADQRRVLILRDGLGLSYEEIGRLARVPVGTAKSYVHRGREALRRCLQERSLA